MPDSALALSSPAQAETGALSDTTIVAATSTESALLPNDALAIPSPSFRFPTRLRRAFAMLRLDDAMRDQVTVGAASIPYAARNAAAPYSWDDFIVTPRPGQRKQTHSK